MAQMVEKAKFWSNKKVLITGHTGFKGTWLSAILSRFGAKVYGYSLEPVVPRSMYCDLGMDSVIEDSCLNDIRNEGEIAKYIESIQPEIVFHLAAQPLVRRSYLDPIETYSTNVLGTVNLLNGCRSVKSIKSIINITTDKCYENNEWDYPYRENDRLGGFDPYSNSKACSELVSSSFRQSYHLPIATARAGNVVGGGDWSVDRLIPDVVRSILQKSVLNIRYPDATRPWQHVLEPLRGYMLLAEKVFYMPEKYCGAWNFGPGQQDVLTVGAVLALIQSHPFGASLVWEHDKQNHPHEATLLSLDNTKSLRGLEWTPCLNIQDVIKYTMGWYSKESKSDLVQLTNQQIVEYFSKAKYE